MKKSKRKAIGNGPVFVRHNNPFANLSEEQINIALQEIAGNCANDFTNQYSELVSIITEHNPLHILSVLSAYGMTLGISEHGSIKNVATKSSFSQSHIEIIQALSLAGNSKEGEGKIANPQTIQTIIDLIVKSSRNFSMKRLVQIEKAKKEEDKYILKLQEEIRNHTHFVRNWGHHKQVKEICTSMYKNLDSDFQLITGIKCTELISMFELMIEQVEAALTERQMKLQLVFKSKTIKDIVKVYCEQYQIPEKSDELLKTFTENNVPAKHAKYILLSHSELVLPDTYLFPTKVLAQKIGVDEGILSKFMNHIGHRFGDLESVQIETIFLDNPIWTKPVIILDNGVVFCPIPSMFFSFIFNIIGGIFKLNHESAVRHEKRRADYLEARAAELLSTAFPSCSFATNIKMKFKQEEFESDFVMRVDSYLILAEMKSGSISGPALRGAPKRIKRHIDELIVDPSTQSERIASMFIDIRDHGDTNVKLLSQVPFVFCGIQKVLRLSITLEDFATIQSNVSALKGTKWIDESFVPAVSMTLSDLELVLNSLSRQSERIHYFVRRSEFQENLRYKGDELDLLGFYIENTFCIGELEHNGSMLVLTGMSKKIDDYYIALENGFPRKAPKIKLTKWWGDILNHIENKKFQRWSEAAVILLDVSYNDQVSVERLFKKIAKNVAKQSHKTVVKDSAVIQPPIWKSNAIAFIAIRDSQWGQRHDLMRNISATIFAEGQAVRCLVLAIDIEQKHYPYSVLGWFDRSVE